MLQFSTVNGYTSSGVYLLRSGHLICRLSPVSHQFSSLLFSCVWMLWITCSGRLGATCKASLKSELPTSYLFSTTLTKWKSWPIQGFWSTIIHYIFSHDLHILIIATGGYTLAYSIRKVTGSAERHHKFWSTITPCETENYAQVPLYREVCREINFYQFSRLINLYRKIWFIFSR